MTRRIVTWLLFALVVGFFAHRPAFSPLQPGHAELTLSMAHLTQRLEPCRQLTPEERAVLPPNMRVVEVCERPRAPAVVELDVGGQLSFEGEVRPAGLHRDGRAYLVRSWQLPAGEYQISFRLRDTPRSKGYDLERSLLVNVTENAAVVLQVGDGDMQVLNTPRTVK